MNERTIAGKSCFVYGDGSSDVLLIQPIGEHNLDSMDSEVAMIEEMSGGKDFSMVMFLTDWNQDLPPWGAPAMRGEELFGEGAPDTLTFIREHLIQEVSSGKEHEIYLGGYSLAGLFAMWATYQTNLFAGVAAASPSLWYPGWPAFAEKKQVRAPKVYLSLGKKEEKTRHPVMQTVGENIRKQFDLARRSPKCEDVILEMNPGNHFQDADLRMAKGFAWLLSGELANDY